MEGNHCFVFFSADSCMVRVSPGFPFPSSIVLPLPGPQLDGESPYLQAALIPRLFRAGLSKGACSMYNQGATMHKIAHTHTKWESFLSAC